MKKAIFAVFIIVCLAALTACSLATAKGRTLLAEGKVKTVSVSSLPKQYDYSYTGEEAQAIVDYISDLNLITVFFEDPNTLYGMSWIITVEYDDGNVIKICNFGRFMRSEIADNRWYKINNDEASRFGSLLDELNG